MKKLLASALSLALLLAALAIPVRAAGVEEKFPAINEYPGYTDVPAGTWYEEGVKLCYETGLMIGTDKGFNPEQNMKVAEVAVIAARMHDILCGGTGKLPISSPWYQSALDALGDLGVTGLEDPGADATRGQFLSMLSAVTPNELLEPINAITTLPDSASPTVLKFYNAGILTGTDRYGTFAADKPLTRREGAAMAARIVRTALRKTFTLAELPGKAITAEDFDLIAYLTGIPADAVLWEKDGVSVTAERFFYEAAILCDFSMKYVGTENPSFSQMAEQVYEITDLSILNQVIISMALSKAIPLSYSVSRGSPLTEKQVAVVDKIMNDHFKAGKTDEAFALWLVDNCATENLFREIAANKNTSGTSTSSYADNVMAAYSITQEEFVRWGEENGVVRARMLPIGTSTDDEDTAIALANEINAASDPYAAFDAAAIRICGSSYNYILQDYTLLPDESNLYTGVAALEIGSCVQALYSFGGFTLVQRMPLDVEKGLSVYQAERYNAEFNTWYNSILNDSAVLKQDVNIQQFYDNLLAFRAVLGLSPTGSDSRQITYT